MKNKKILILLLSVIVLFSAFPSFQIVSADVLDDGYVNIQDLGICQLYKALTVDNEISGYDFWVASVSDGYVRTKSVYDNYGNKFTLRNFYNVNGESGEYIGLRKSTQLVIDPVNDLDEIVLRIDFSYYDGNEREYIYTAQFFDVSELTTINFSDFEIDGQKLPNSESDPNAKKYLFYSMEILRKTDPSSVGYSDYSFYAHPVFEWSDSSYYTFYTMLINTNIYNPKNNASGKYQFDLMYAQIAKIQAVLLIYGEYCPAQLQPQIPYESKYKLHLGTPTEEYIIVTNGNKDSINNGFITSSGSYYAYHNEEGIPSSATMGEIPYTDTSFTLSENDYGIQVLDPDLYEMAFTTTSPEMTAFYNDCYFEIPIRVYVDLPEEIEPPPEEPPEEPGGTGDNIFERYERTLEQFNKKVYEDGLETTVIFNIVSWIAPGVGFPLLLGYYGYELFNTLSDNNVTISGLVTYIVGKPFVEDIGESIKVLTTVAFKAVESAFNGFKEALSEAPVWEQAAYYISLVGSILVFLGVVGYKIYDDRKNGRSNRKRR